MLITAESLQALRACAAGVAWFHARFPEGTDPAGWTTSEWSTLLAFGWDARRYIEWALDWGLVSPPLAGLATDPDYEVRRWVAQRLPPESPALAGLATDTDIWVRRLVAERLDDPGRPASAPGRPASAP